MALSNEHKQHIFELLEQYMEFKRPPENVRHLVDISFRLEGNSVFIFEIRPRYNDPKIIHESPVAKATFIDSKNEWKLFWMRADLKWHHYKEEGNPKTIEEVIEIIDTDRFGCFWG